ncbi:PHP domain-containing protein [Candidatus Bathyarchaeota archaeon]|nr:PHP domain-containing protein [Candidatus Bathyarchaeota archaeon]
MKNISDYHVHTRQSGCCKEEYGIVDAAKVAASRGIRFLGITDHDVPFKNGYLPRHRKIVDTLDIDGITVHLGLEASIRNARGKIQVSSSNLSLLDFLSISEHVHIMPRWTLMRRGRKHLIESWWNDPTSQYQLEKFYTRHARMTQRAIERYQPDILAHPWRFPWHAGFLDKATIVAYQDTLEAAAKNGTCIEISKSAMALVLSALEGQGSHYETFLDQEKFPRWKGKMEHEVMEPVAFFTVFFKICQQKNIKFTLGSDAHRMEDIGRYPPLDRVLGAIGIQQNAIKHVLIR